MKNGKDLYFDRDECSKRIIELFGANTPQKEIAQNLGIDQSTVSDLKNGKGMSMDTLYKIAVYYQVSFDYLVGISPIKDHNITPGDIQSVCAVTGMEELAVRGLLSIKDTPTGKGLQSLLVQHYVSKASIHQSLYPGIDTPEISHDSRPTLLDLIGSFMVSAYDYSPDTITFSIEPNGNMHIAQDKEAFDINTPLLNISETINLSEIVMDRQIDGIIHALQMLKRNHIRRNMHSTWSGW